MPIVKIAFMSYFHHHLMVEPNDFCNYVANGNACYFNVLITATKPCSELIIKREQRQISDATEQGSKFVVAMVANATMFSHLLPGCSCGSKQLLLP